MTESSGDVDGIYKGMPGSGSYAFIWDNPSKGAVLNVDTDSGSSGSIQFIFQDSRGKEALNETLSGASDAFSVDGKKGKWKIKVVFSEFDGEGSFDVNPVN